VVHVDELMEMNMGEWEGMTTPEIADRWPDLMKQIYEDGEDLPRGSSGESWGQLTVRVAEALAKLDHGDEGPTVAVAHGGAIRSYISSLTATTDTHSESFFTPANTSISHIAVTERGPEILDFGVATHLESMLIDSQS
jgi:broad specificity phosphatase PhoE